MYLDEKIASLDRLRRENMEKESEKNHKEEPLPRPLTIEEALDGIREGKLRREGIPFLEFETYATPQKIPVAIFKNFFDAKQENEEGMIFLKRDKEISQILSWPKAEITPTTFEQWGNLLVNGMAANRIHTEIRKTKQLAYIEYICYEIPSGKGPVYNVMFRFKDKACNMLGNYNCMCEDRETYGIIFEAMMAALDQWAADGAKEAQDGKEEQRQ